MKLFLVHCGYYDLDTCQGIYESHLNLFVVATDFDDAKARVKRRPEFKAKKLHVDGLVEVRAVDGHAIVLEPREQLRGESVFVGSRFRELAPGRTK